MSRQMVENVARIYPLKKTAPRKSAGFKLAPETLPRLVALADAMHRSQGGVIDALVEKAYTELKAADTRAALEELRSRVAALEEKLGE